MKYIYNSNQPNALRNVLVSSCTYKHVKIIDIYLLRFSLSDTRTHFSEHPFRIIYGQHSKHYDRPSYLFFLAFSIHIQLLGSSSGSHPHQGSTSSIALKNRKVRVNKRYLGSLKMEVLMELSHVWHHPSIHREGLQSIEMTLYWTCIY